MKASVLELCCPICKGDLQETLREEPGYFCSACSAQFPIIQGIPDFRVFDDPYISIEADRAKAARIAERFNDFDFAGFVGYYYSITEAVPASQARRFSRGLKAAPARAEAALTMWEQHDAAAANRRGSLLELGCGTAPLLLAAAARYEAVAGIDIALRWLIVGKKRLAEAGVDVPLICACAEALPFRASTFDYVVADSSIEHFRDVERGLREAHRVGKAGARLFIATPNRWSLGPDPHVGIPAGGYLPRRWLDAYARKRRAVPPKRNLQSARTLRRALSATGFENTGVFLPGFPAAQRAQYAAHVRIILSAYELARRLPVSRHLLYAVGPLLYAVARKVGGANPRSAALATSIS